MANARKGWQIRCIVIVVVGSPGCLAVRRRPHSGQDKPLTTFLGLVLSPRPLQFWVRFFPFSFFPLDCLARSEVFML